MMTNPNSQQGANNTGNEAQRQQQLNQNQDNPHYNRFLIYLVTVVGALGGFLFGYDTGVISGAELYLKTSFSLGNGTEELAVSAVLIGAVIGAIIGGRLGDILGRKLMILIIAVIFTAGAIVTALSPSIWFFIALRIIVGIALGAVSVLSPIYISEMAPPRLRGALVTVNQFLLTIGIVSAYAVDLAFASAHMSWPPMFAVAAIPAIILFIGMFFLPDTPRWYASKGRWEKADHTADRLSPKIQTKISEMDGLHKSIQETKSAKPTDLFKPGLRVALIVGVGLAILQQFVAINTIIYYAPTIFGYAGYKSATGAILATVIVGIVNVVSTLLAIFLMDRLGRRLLLLIGIGGMALMLAALGVIFMIGPSSVGVLVLIVLLVYIVSFAISLGPVYWVMSSEIFPNRLRGTGSSISTACNWGANLLISVTFLSMVAALGKPITFWIYMIFAIVAFFFVLFLVPETKGKRLEQIEAYWNNGREWPEESNQQDQQQQQPQPARKAS
jgi:SP family galactose:H+ symporter-like MFS transporter